ncbi:MAG TPA: LCP family protein [Candidatus Saccharimonadales bacterium]|nr:LCP family protein [Candidatus Saccharimonadales bacterium]
MGFLRRNKITIVNADITRPNPQPVSSTRNINPGGHRWLRWVIWSLVIIIVGILGWVGTAGFLAFKKIGSTNGSDEPAFFKNGSISLNDVNSEGDSRINVLLLGVGGDAHPGGNLTDTMEVISIDPVNKSMAMMSIPRDLYVKRVDGTWGKINEVYSNGTAYCKIKACSSGVDPGGAAVKDMVGSIIGLPIHYFIKMDFTGFENIINTLGGVQINVTQRLYDPLYPAANMVNYAPIDIKAGLQTMDGATALKYARSRETTSDFDRSRRQQQVLSAARQKALTLNILTNPVKITSIITSLGNHLKTDISTTDMAKFALLLKDVDGKETKTLVLDTSDTGPLKNGVASNGAYILVPKKGLGDYSEIQDLTLTVFTDPNVIKEAAKVLVVDATSKTGTGTTVATLLKSHGYNVIGNLVAATTQATTAVQDSGNKPYSLKLLEKRFKLTKSSKIPSSNTSGADIIVTLGKDYAVK